VIGFALGHIEVFYDGRHFCLRELAVSPGAQRQGVGARLLRHVEKRLADAGVS